MNQPLRKSSGFFTTFLVVLAPLAAYSQVTDSTNTLTTAQLLDMSGGARVKLVWARMEIPGNPEGNVGPNHTLVVFDTDEKKQRTLQDSVGTYDRPIITRDGTRVIWNDQINAESWICNWDGSGKRRLLKGNNTTIAAHVASTRWDSVEKKDYLYVGVADGSIGNQVVSPRIYSYPLVGLTIDTTQKKVVWDSATAGSGVCGMTWFSVSADGKYAAGQMSGGVNCLGLVDLATQKIVETRASAAGALGCMPNSAPDNSRMWFHSMAGHGLIYLYRYGQGGNAMWVRPDSAYYPATGTWSYKGGELQHWSNHPRFLTVGSSMGFAGDAQTAYNIDVHSRWNFYLGRFNAGFTKVEKWIQVSHARYGYAEYSGDAWFDLGNAATVQSNPFCPAIRKTSLRVHESSAYDIQGRRMQKMPGTELRGVYIERGRLRLMAR